MLVWHGRMIASLSLPPSHLLYPAGLVGTAILPVPQLVQAPHWMASVVLVQPETFVLSPPPIVRVLWLRSRLP